DGVGGAGPRAQLAADALLEAVGVTVELVTAVVARLSGRLLERVLLRDRLAEEVADGDAEAGDRREDGAQPLLLGEVRHERGVGAVGLSVGVPDVVRLGHLAPPFLVALDSTVRPERGDGGRLWPGLGGTGKPPANGSISPVTGSGAVASARSRL